MLREVFKFRDVPFPCGVASSTQIDSGGNGEEECVKCLRDESKAEIHSYFEHVVWADDDAEEASFGDFVACFSFFSSLIQKNMVVHVTNNAYYKHSNSDVFQINGWLWKCF